MHEEQHPRFACGGDLKMPCLFYYIDTACFCFFFQASFEANRSFSCYLYDVLRTKDSTKLVFSWRFFPGPGNAAGC